MPQVWGGDLTEEGVRHGASHVAFVGSVCNLHSCCMDGRNGLLRWAWAGWTVHA